MLLRRYLPLRLAGVLISLHSNAKAWLYFGLTTGSLLLLLSNSFTRLFRTIWPLIGDNWACIWSYILSFGFSHATLYIVGSSLLHVLTYWSYALLLLAFDCMTVPHALTQYKVQPSKNVPVERSKLYSCVKQVAINQLLVAAPLNALTYPIAVWRGVGFELPLPSFEQFCYDVAVFLIVEEILFERNTHYTEMRLTAVTPECWPQSLIVSHVLSTVLGSTTCIASCTRHSFTAASTSSITSGRPLSP